MIESDDKQLEPLGLARAETDVVGAMHAYVRAVDSLQTSDDRAAAVADMTRARRHFRGCVRDWAIEAHLANVPPEQALVRVKALLRQFLGAPERNVGIAEQAVAWAIAAYYETR